MEEWVLVDETSKCTTQPVQCETERACMQSLPPSTQPGRAGSQQATRLAARECEPASQQRASKRTVPTLDPSPPASIGSASQQPLARPSPSAHRPRCHPYRAGRKGSSENGIRKYSTPAKREHSPLWRFSLSPTDYRRLIRLSPTPAPLASHPALDPVVRRRPMTFCFSLG